VDIGDRVKVGTGPRRNRGAEMGQQIKQAQAAIDQGNSSNQQGRSGRCCRDAATRNSRA